MANALMAPCVGEERGDESNHSGDRSRDGGAGPGHLTCARVPPPSKDNRSYHSVKLDDPSFTAPIYANLFEGDDATGEGNLCSQTSIDCWAKIPAIAPCDDAWVTEGKKGVARSPAA